MKQLKLRMKDLAANKEEEFFRMCLLSFQINNKENMKVMKLDYRSLYKQVTDKHHLPFFKWNDWLKECVERLQFEYIYKKKTEFEYAKMLS